MHILWYIFHSMLQIPKSHSPPHHTFLPLVVSGNICNIYIEDLLARWGELAEKHLISVIAGADWWHMINNKTTIIFIGWTY